MEIDSHIDMKNTILSMFRGELSHSHSVEEEENKRREFVSYTSNPHSVEEKEDAAGESDTCGEEGGSETGE